MRAQVYSTPTHKQRWAAIPFLLGSLDIKTLRPKAEMLRITDRHEREMLYGPTNEEMITEIVRAHIRSYKDLPKLEQPRGGGGLFGGLFSILAGGYRYFKVVDGVSRAGRHLAIFRGVVSKTASVAVKAFGLLRMGAMFLARGLMQAGLMMLANPIVLAIVAVIAVVGLLAWAIYANWDKIKAAFAAGKKELVVPLLQAICALRGRRACG